jgi:hypothetical protein
MARTSKYRKFDEDFKQGRSREYRRILGVSALGCHPIGHPAGGGNGPCARTNSRSIERGSVSAGVYSGPASSSLTAAPLILSLVRRFCVNFPASWRIDAGEVPEEHDDIARVRTSRLYSPP